MIGITLILLALQTQPVRAWRQAHEHAILREFIDLLSLPNVAANLSDMRRNATHIQGLFEKRGVKTRLLEAPGSPPAIYGELPAPGSKQTVIFYVHYDGQPVEPEKWTMTGKNPFRPTLRSATAEVPFTPETKLDPEWRLYARSAGDDKAPIIALLAALDALRAANLAPRANIKFLLDGEEEAGSPHLGQIVEANKELLNGDFWLFCDGPVHQTRRPLIAFGARGSTGFHITVYGPNHELHSGHYGNWAPNPAFMLAQLLASMKDTDGRVLIKDFYKGVEPFSDTEKKAVAAMPNVDAQLMDEFGLARTEKVGSRLEEAIQMPSLNIRGLSSGAVGAGSRNVIPSEATASLDIRVVKGIDYRVAVERVKEHIRSQGYYVTDRDPDDAMRRRYPRIAKVTVRDGDNSVRTSMDLEVSQLVIRAVEAARGPVIKAPLLGGTLPLQVFEEVLHRPVIVVPIANHDDNQHSHNENIRLQNLWDGIETMAALLSI